MGQSSRLFEFFAGFIPRLVDCNLANGSCRHEGNWGKSIILHSHELRLDGGKLAHFRRISGALRRISGASRRISAHFGAFPAQLAHSHPNLELLTFSLGQQIAFSANTLPMSNIA
jgi:hypothetical protein